MDILYTILTFISIAYVLLSDYVSFKKGKFAFSLIEKPIVKTVEKTNEKTSKKSGKKTIKKTSEKPFNIGRFLASVLFVFSISLIRDEGVRFFSTIGAILTVILVQTTLELLLYKKTKNQRNLWRIAIVDSLLIFALMVVIKYNY